MMPQGQEVAVDVTWQDQQHINTFGRLNRRLNDFKQQLAIKKTDKEALQDASNDLLLADDDEGVLYAMGDGFMKATKDEVEATIAKEEEKLDKEIDEITSQMDATKEEMSKLKVVLYAKFKNSINLEES